MEELRIVKYLISEIEEELKYNKEFKVAYKEAKEEAKKNNSNYAWGFISKKYERSPRNSVILDDIKTARRLLLNLSKAVGHNEMEK